MVVLNVSKIMTQNHNLFESRVLSYASPCHYLIFINFSLIVTYFDRQNPTVCLLFSTKLDTVTDQLVCF